MSKTVLIKDISFGEENNKISLLNDVDFEVLPNDFQYTLQNCMSTGANAEDFESVSNSCSCIGVCQEDSCYCNENYEFAFLNDHIKNKFTEFKCKPVIECSPLCTCDSNCSNRVTQHGIQCQLRVFKTKMKGFGVQTLDEIKMFSYVCEYAGEIIGVSEAKRRFDSQKIDDSNYIFVLTEHCHGNNKIVTIIDPTYCGNVGRFLNHSCSPNLFTVPVRSENMVPRLCFFASRDILPFEELCYDYGALDLQQNISFNDNISQHNSQCYNFKKCNCQSLNCINYLPYYPNLLLDSESDDKIRLKLAQ